MKKLFSLLLIAASLTFLISSCSKNDTAVPTGSSGSTPVTQTYSSTPNKTIAPNDWTNDSINANVSFGINAQNISDVKLNLGSLEGITISNLRFALVHRGVEVFVIDTPIVAPGSGNMTNTVLSDSGHMNISNGTYPFTGTFRPQVPLSTFLNSDPSGYWTLKIYNSGSFRTGVIKSWSITITYLPSVQIPALDSRYLPMIGDTRKFVLCDTNNVNPGPSGANITWDFSNLNKQTFEYTDEYVQPILSPIFWRFSQSNIANRNFDLYQEMFTFFKIIPSSNTFIYYGEGDSSFNGLKYYQYIDPVQLVKTPIYTYNTFVQDSGRTKSQNYLNANTTSNGVYKDSIHADGWGTLKLPGGVTLNNILREKMVIATMDTVNGNQMYYTNMKIYSWYQVGYKFPVFRIQTYLKFNAAMGGSGWKLVEVTTQNTSISK